MNMEYAEPLLHDDAKLEMRGHQSAFYATPLINQCGQFLTTVPHTATSAQSDQIFRWLTAKGIIAHVRM